MDVALFTEEGLVMILRWIHFFAGVAWIGHLYYFNFVQGEFFKEIDAPVKQAVDFRNQMLLARPELIARERGHARLDAAAADRDAREAREKNPCAQRLRPGGFAQRQQPVPRAVSE